MSPGESDPEEVWIQSPDDVAKPPGVLTSGHLHVGWGKIPNVLRLVVLEALQQLL